MAVQLDQNINSLTADAPLTALAIGVSAALLGVALAEQLGAESLPSIDGLDRAAPSGVLLGRIDPSSQLLLAA